MNLPNKLTTLRIILVPILVFFLLMRHHYPIFAEGMALFTFIVAALTDGLDGYLARKHELVTKLGKILDPLADKLLITGALISFVAMNEISAWAALIIIGRELAVTGLRVVAAGEGVIISANKWGKWKTTMQIVAISAVIIEPELINLPDFLIISLVWIAVIITVYSGYGYFHNTEINFKA